VGKLRFIAPQQIALCLASLVLCIGCSGDAKPMMSAARAGSAASAAGASAGQAAGAGGASASAISGAAGAAVSGAAGGAGMLAPTAGAAGATPATNMPMGSTMTPPSMTATAGTNATGAAGDMASAGAGATDPGGAPKDAVNTDQMGPYKFEKYTEGLTNPTYASSVMYYPTDAPTPFGAAVFSPGFTATKENYEMFLGPLLASHGIAILLTTPTTTGDFPQQRAEDLQAAVEQIAKENTREGSPVKGKLAPDRVCVTGHSMGGGGTLWAASALGDKIKCAVPLQPWQPGQSFSMIKAPTMFIAAQSDTVAGVAQNASLFYASIPDSVKKYYVEFAGASHFLTTNDLGTAYDVQSKYMIAFYKTYLDGDMRYLDVLNGPMDTALSKYEHTK
jgi:dienelactone hydrolase